MTDTISAHAPATVAQLKVDWRSPARAILRRFRARRARRAVETLPDWIRADIGLPPSAVHRMAPRALGWQALR